MTASAPINVDNSLTQNSPILSPLFGSSPDSSKLTLNRTNNLLGPPLTRNQTIKPNKFQSSSSNNNKKQQTLSTNLNSTNLSNLPHEVLILLVETLLNDLEVSKEHSLRKEREITALQKLCLENGIEEEEIRRVQKIALETVELENDLDGNSSVGTENEIDENGDLGGDAESTLDLDGLTEAITENAFSFSHTDLLPSDNDNYPNFTIDTRHPSSRLQSNDSKSQQQRHSSLSSRLFGTTALFSSSTSPTSSATSSNLGGLFSPPSITPSNRTRSDSMKSVASNVSIPASVDSSSSSLPKQKSIIEGQNSSGYGYGEWIGWKGWKSAGSKGKKSSTQEVDNESIKSNKELSLPDVEDEIIDTEKLVAPTSNIKDPLSPITTTDLVSSSSSSSIHSNSKARPLSLTTSPASSQMIARSKGPSDTLLSPQLAPIGPTLSTISVAPSTPTHISTSTLDKKSVLTSSPETSKSRRSSSSLQPNLTLFPKLSSLSKYSPFAQPALSTPSPQVSLSSHPSSPIVPIVPVVSLPPTISTSTTMELDVIPVEALPPAIQNNSGSSKRSQSGNGAVAEPLVDRYGFIYDVRSGMKLLREARGREERRLAGEEESVENGLKEGEEGIITVEDQVLQNRLDIETQISDLSESLGLPPSTSSSSSNANKTDSNLLSPINKSNKLIRTISSESNASSIGGGTQSMKLLLGQLTEMHDGVERVQRDAWDSFIKRRQVLLAGGEFTSSSDLNQSSNKKNKNKNKNKIRNISISNGSTSSNSELSNPLVEEVSETSSSGDWSENLVGVAQMGITWKTGKEDWQEFKSLVKKGIPIVHRAKIWAECSGANEAREPGCYQELLSQHQGEKNQCLNQIDMDCHRTFPTNVFFAGTGPGVAKLRNILVAYSGRNPTIGYCQGMNNLTATLLLIYPSEEDAFWVLICIIEKILPSDYYTSQLLVSQADQRVLQSLVSQHLPEVALHLEDLGVELPAITFGWFLSLFTDTLPVQTLLRIWDLLFVWGTIILFRIAFAILQMHKKEILECDSAASLYALMRSITNHLYSVDKVITIACDELRSIIKDKEVEGLRSIHVEALRAEMELNSNLN